jgi:hypothetical protein
MLLIGEYASMFSVGWEWGMPAAAGMTRLFPLAILRSITSVVILFMTVAFFLAVIAGGILTVVIADEHGRTAGGLIHTVLLIALLVLLFVLPNTAPHSGTDRSGSGRRWSECSSGKARWLYEALRPSPADQPCCSSGWSSPRWSRRSRSVLPVKA